jgi:predicted ribosome quality control (RQC) complex YloA/Tae2 family protein
MNKIFYYFYNIKIFLMIRIDMKRIVTRFIPSLHLNVVYKVGKDAQNNHQIIDESNKDDLWFHINNTSSCHVIACLKNIRFNRYDDELPNYYDIDFDSLDNKQKQQIVKQGAILCKQFSRLNNQKNVEIIYTKIENVCKTEPIGSVITYKTKTIII